MEILNYRYFILLWYINIFYNLKKTYIYIYWNYQTRAEKLHVFYIFFDKLFKLEYPNIFYLVNWEINLYIY